MFNFYLKVRVKKSRVKLFFHSTAYSKIQHYTPAMQISYINTSKSTYSPTLNSEGRTRLFNGVTSTPTSHIKNALFIPNKLSPLRSPPMYSLSEVSSASSRSPKPIQNVSGPLLASTKFNVNLGTYADTKSPGLTNRIIQYSNEASQKQTPTHQLKYGSPGLFPVVHFFKKDIPIMSPKQRKVTVKIASPDTSWYNSPGFAAKKNVAKSPNLQNGHDLSQLSADTETRSVLDALKEISRKRINTSTDFESEQDACKRQKRSEKNQNSPESNKRTREESPISESPNNSIQPSAKKVCVVDLLAASYTSSQLFQEQLLKGLEKRDKMENVENVANKPAHLLTVSTQTTEAVKTTEIKDAAGQTDTKESDLQESPKNKSPKANPPEEECRYANIFDANKLEINRKNKLAMLLSAVTGEPPILIPYEKPKVTSLSEELQKDTISIPTSTPKLVSILSPQNKPKHDKHVTFNLPSEKNESREIVSVTTQEVITSESSVAVSLSTSISTPTKSNLPSNNIINNAETPKSVLPIPAVTKLDFGISNAGIVSKEEDKQSIISSKTEETKTTTPQVTGFAFKPLIQANAITSAATISFGSQNTTTSTSTASNISSFASTSQMFASPKDTSPKSGGFKFDLTKSSSDIKNSLNNTTHTTTSSDAPKLTFGTNQQITSINSTSELKATNANIFKTPPISASVKPTFSFGSDKSSTQSNINNVPAFTSAIFNTANINNTKPVISPAIPAFGTSTQDFNVDNGKQMGATPTTSELIAATTGSNTLTFGASSSGQIYTSSTFSTPQVSSSAFGVQSSTTSPFGIQSTNLVTSSTFGSVPTSQILNSAFSTVPSSSVPSFGFSNTNLTSPTTTVTPTFNTTQAFGNMVTTSLTTTGFGTPKTTPSFGTPTAAIFGNSTTSSPFTPTSGFGNNTTGIPTFGSTVPAEKNLNTTTTPSSGFGNNTTGIPTFGSTVQAEKNLNTIATPTPGFGNNTTGIPTFGSTVPAEKNLNTTTTSSSIFVTNPANQTFNTITTSSSGFGTNLGSKPFAFGPNNNANTTFTASNTTPNFNFTATTSSNTTFTSKSVPSFGTTFTSNAFGTSTIQSSNTVPATSNIFKSPTSTFGNPQFGSKPENTFGAKPESNTFGTKPDSNAFGTKSENNAFGNFNNSFPSSNNPTGFGANPSTTNAFGTNANPSAFGTANNSSTFGAAPNSNNFGATPNSTAFGTNTGNSSSFGATNNNPSAFGGTPNIGSGFGANPNNSTIFGASSNAANNTFTSSTNNNAFGTGSSFGSANTTAPAFGFNSGDNSSAFSKPQSSAGVFGNVGSGDTTFQFANNSNQGFGAGSTTVATSSPSSVFAFGGSNSTATPGTGVFTFGSADTKPSFNFNAGTNPTPGFGAGVPTFNAGSTPAFNPTSPQFGNTMTGVFNIGSGSSSGNRSRTQLKTKRRT